MKTTVLLLTLVLAAAICHADTIFLDNCPGVINGSTTYDPAARTCGKGSSTVYTKIGEASKALSGGDKLYIRSGTYSRTPTGTSFEGALNITASGTPTQRTVVRSYPGEEHQAVICAKQDTTGSPDCRYNPDPGQGADGNRNGSGFFYPNPAITIKGRYIDVVGLKTYGQVYIRPAHDVTVQNCDLGGGGPAIGGQGQVVMIHSSYNVILRSNRIHHSCRAVDGLPGHQNGPAVMCYDASFIIENNEFYDNWFADIRVKDTGGQQGRTIIIRNNFFRPSSIYRDDGIGIEGIGQDGKVDRILIHNNIFYRKEKGIEWDGPALKGTEAYNNTFVDCKIDINQWFKNARIELYNNLHYHIVPGARFYMVVQHDEPQLRNLRSNHNLFYSKAGETSWHNIWRKRASNLSEWRKYSGKDGDSVAKDPGFVNPAGDRPEDFKRRGDREKIMDVDDSNYGPVCGAYVTGDEIVGLIPEKASKPSPSAGKQEEAGWLVWSFEEDDLGAVPEGWRAAGPMATWQVIEDKTAPSGRKILALTSHKRKSNSVRDACWTDTISFLGGEIQARFKAVEGDIEKGGGLIWRVQDEKTYYSARTNYGPRGNNVGLYCMVNWDRVWKVYAENVFLSVDEWYTMKIVHSGDNIKVYINDRKLIDVTHENSPLSNPGGVGVGTKGDAITSFDDLMVRFSESRVKAPK